MQSWLLLQLLNSLLTSPLELAALKVAAQGYVCQGSPSQIKLGEAAAIAAGLIRPDLSQPVCWTPLELEGAIAYVICKLLAQVGGPIIL